MRASTGKDEEKPDGIQYLSYACHENGIQFGIRVQPKSAKTAVAGIWEGRLKLNLTAPPAENAANKQCIAFLARIFGKKKQEVAILSGLKSRSKTVFVTGLDAVTFQAKLKKLVKKEATS